jgi:hypothetical protein
MINLNEEIDLVLEGSLLEYTDVRDFRVDEPTIARLEKGAAREGLDPTISKEMVGLFRLMAVAKLSDRTSPVLVPALKALMPDFVVNPPVKLEDMISVFNKSLNDESGTYVVPGEPRPNYEAYKDKIVELARLINGLGTSAIDGKEYDLDFKKFVGILWKGREQAMQEFIKNETDILVKKLSDGSIAGAKIFPSEIAKNTKYLDFYSDKLVPFINKNQRKVDDLVKEFLEKHEKTIERHMKEYKSNNDQKTKTYGYAPPLRAGFENSKKSWLRFIAYKLKLGEMIRKAIDDTVNATPEPPDTFRILTHGVSGAPIRERLIKEDKLATITIDFDDLRKQKLDESFLAMFGGWVEHILGAMFGNRVLPLVVKGSQRDVESFASALGGEKSYLDAVKRYGLDHPTTYKNKSKLDNAIKGFEKETGLKWPFK